MKTKTIKTKISIESSSLAGGPNMTRQAFAFLLDRFGYSVDSAGIEGEFATITLVNEMDSEEEPAQETEVTDRKLPFPPNAQTKTAAPADESGQSAGFETTANECGCPACTLRRLISSGIKEGGGGPFIVNLADIFGPMIKKSDLN